MVMMYQYANRKMPLFLFLKNQRKTRFKIQKKKTCSTVLPLNLRYVSITFGSNFVPNSLGSALSALKGGFFSKKKTKKRTKTKNKIESVRARGLLDLFRFQQPQRSNSRITR